MEILNVVLIYNGVLDHIKSFRITAKTEKNKQKQIAKAEKYFVQLIKNDNAELTEKDIASYIEEDYYTDDNGYDLYLDWSYIG